MNKYKLAGYWAKENTTQYTRAVGTSKKEEDKERKQNHDRSQISTSNNTGWLSRFFATSPKPRVRSCSSFFCDIYYVTSCTLYLVSPRCTLSQSPNPLPFAVLSRVQCRRRAGKREREGRRQKRRRNKKQSVKRALKEWILRELIHSTLVGEVIQFWAGWPI